MQAKKKVEVNTKLHEHKLYGCKTTPLSNYLKAIGIIRALSKKYPATTAHWENDYCVVQANITKEQMFGYFLEEYEPPPIISLWSYNKYEKTKAALRTMIESDDGRYKTYKNVLDEIENSVLAKFKQILDLTKVSKADVDANKTILFQMCRNTLHDEYVMWLDSVAVIGAEKQYFAPLLGSGGNDGNFDLAENFVKCMKLVLPPCANMNTSAKWLNSALFGDVTTLARINTVGHNPDGSGGPNAGSGGFEGASMSNPWDYVLMIEGVLSFAGGISKRLSNIRGKAMFSFAVGASNVGYATASANDTDDGQEPESKGEVWLPVWLRPTTYKELEQVFREGRLQVGGRHAKTGVEAARSVITMGTERGIDKFERYGILKRKGKQYLFINSGTIRVADDSTANLLDDLDKWYSGIVSTFIKGKKSGSTLARFLRNYDDAVMRFCTTRKQHDMLKILEFVGKIERHTSILPDNYEPLQVLSSKWLDACYDGSPEFRLATSAASILYSGAVGSIRTNLECLELNKYKIWERPKNSVSFVWKEDDLLDRNMSRVLQRRAVDGQINSLDVIPIDGAIPSHIGDIGKFLNGVLDMKKIGNLILPLSCIKMYKHMDYPWRRIRLGTSTESIPEAYMIMKLVCPPLRKYDIKYNTSMLGMLSSGRIGDAYVKAAQSLYSHGFLPHSYSGRNKRLQSTTMSNITKKHIMASLLFPLDVPTHDMILKTVTDTPNNSF